MKPGDLVRLKRPWKEECVGIIIDLRVSETDFHDKTRSKPYIYANILWSKVPIEFQAISGNNNLFELATDILEIVK